MQDGCYMHRHQLPDGRLRRWYPYLWNIFRSPSQRKALEIASNSLLEGAYCYLNEWQRWADTNPDDTRSRENPYDSTLLRMLDDYEAKHMFKRLSKETISQLGEVWDAHKDGIVCAGKCWQASAARQTFDYVWADAMSYSHNDMDNALAQVVALRPLIDEIRGTPGEHLLCETDGECARRELVA